MLTDKNEIIIGHFCCVKYENDLFSTRNFSNIAIPVQIHSNFSRSSKLLIFSVPSSGKSLVVNPVCH